PRQDRRGAAPEGEPRGTGADPGGAGDGLRQRPRSRLEPASGALAGSARGQGARTDGGRGPGRRGRPDARPDARIPPRAAGERPPARPRPGRDPRDAGRPAVSAAPMSHPVEESAPTVRDDLVYLGAGPLLAVILGFALIPFREATNSANLSFP